MVLSTLMALVALQATPAQQQRIAWVPNPRRSDGTWVADPSHHLAPRTVAVINREVADLERATGAELAVVVVDSTSGLTLFDFAMALHRGWGIGKSGRDNGVVLLWVPAQRAIQISVGYGLEGAIPDRLAGRIRDERIIAAFRRGAFDEGMLAGARALADAARADSGGTRRGFTPQMEMAEGGSARGGAILPQSGRAVGILLFMMLASALAGLLAWLLRRWRRHRPRTCPKCRATMVRLDEKADDAFLEKGERLEEKLHGVDYDVWKCGRCGETLKLAYRTRRQGTAQCPACRRMTLQRTESTIRAATSRNGGMKAVVSTCANCGHRFQTTVNTPVLSSSGSSSSDSDWSSADSGSSGGSDFGGGSAGGGGAGGTY